MPEDAVKVTTRTYEQIAEVYAKSHSDPDIKPIADTFLAALKGPKILDVGCAHGRDSKYFSEQDFNVLGIDLVPKFIDMARQNAPLARFKKMDMRKLDFLMNSFDGIWACASFSHVPKSDAEETLNGFNRVLRKDGMMYLPVKRGSCEFFEGDTYGIPRFFANYSRSEIESLLRATGFKVVTDFGSTEKDKWISLLVTKLSP